MPAPQPFVLIPPSEGKAAGGDGPVWAPGQMVDADLDRHRQRVLRAARAAGASPRRAGTRPAMQRYTGVLYGELDWASLPADARRLGERRVRTVSGLWGLVAPADPLPPYRLKMSAALPETGRLASWWRPRLTATLGPLVEGAVVWSLLPNEHAAAIDWGPLTPTQRVTVRFLDEQGRTVSHWNKLLKGSLVRWVLTERPSGYADLASFEHPLGYRFDPAATVVEGATAAVVLRASP
ncbi:MAG: YaaA family protein [Acidimicrobiales bacterium]